ncbi:glycosyl hydrolase family 28-related protein [Luteococcus sp. H138]|uniref:glycosyl hydrolase family 28-related protein n=1 Tax=unclassified Luteococcus TaxID=2639923 RepID=UPI00313AB214
MSITGAGPSRDNRMQEHEMELPNRRSILGASLLGAAGILALPQEKAHAVTSTPSGINVRDYGAKGDGVSNDSAAVKAAIEAAKGDLIFFPSGVYLLDRIAITDTADMLLGIGAELKHVTNSPGNFMFSQTGRFFRIRGGTIDGNKANQSGRPIVIAASLSSGRQLILDGVHFKNTVKAAVYIQNFGGECDMHNCLITDQAQHDTTPGNSTAIVHVISGQANSFATLKFNFNRCIFTDDVAHAGSNPGGVFVAVGAPANGFRATFEAIGNYFYGYGQNCAGNVIAALHVYPYTEGARWIGNYFEASSLSAMYAKCLEDFICTDNYITSGVTSTVNVASEGAIGYAPAYHAGDTAHPRAVISNNIITSPGGQPDRVQNGISIFGSPTSKATQIVVSGNILNDTGTGIQATYSSDITIDTNIVNTTSTQAATHGGIRLDYCDDVSIRNNRITTNAGHGIYLIYGMTNARITIQNNSIFQRVHGLYGIIAQGMKSLHISGNEIEAESHAVTFRAYAGHKIGRLFWDSSNNIIKGLFLPYYGEIDSVNGDLSYSGSPVGTVPAGGPGVRYTSTNASRGSVYWVSTKAGKDGWVALA